MSNARLVLLVCAAQVLAQMGAYTWPALLPGFLDAWALSNAEAGWLTGVFYAAYAVSVPVLVTATDRIDPKRIYLLGVACTVLAHLGFVLWVEGFWSALAFRMLAGIGWAGTYMTGLKLLADRVSGRMMSRATAGHAASIGIAGAASFVVAGGLEAWLGWRAAFAAGAGAAAVAWVAVALAAPRQAGRRPAAGHLFDFRPVFANRSAMAYAVAYCVHTWEMNALRGWGVAFLAWVALAHGDTVAVWLAPTVVITAMALAGTGASVLGNEAAIRLGRQRLVWLAMGISVLLGLVTGFFGALSYPLAVALVMVWGVVIWLDSSSLTAGAAGSADPARRGATLAIHSMFGYGGGFVGPLVVGLVLDAAGGMSPGGWGFAFASVALVMLAGRLAFTRLAPYDLAGDRSNW